MLSSGFLAFAYHAGFLQAVDEVRGSPGGWGSRCGARVGRIAPAAERPSPGADKPRDSSQPTPRLPCLQAGIKVAGVMGTSAGALTGSLYAAGYTPRQVRHSGPHTGCARAPLPGRPAALPTAACLTQAAPGVSPQPPSTCRVWLRAALQVARLLSEVAPVQLLRPCLTPWDGGLLSLDAVVERLRDLLPPTFEDLPRDFACGVVAARCAAKRLGRRAGGAAQGRGAGDLGAVATNTRGASGGGGGGSGSPDASGRAAAVAHGVCDRGGAHGSSQSAGLVGGPASAPRICFPPPVCSAVPRQGVAAAN